MKRVLTVALSTLLLLAGVAVAEPPTADIESDHSQAAGADHREALLLSENALATITGAGWRTSTCTAGLKLTGFAFLVGGALNRNPIQTAIGSALIRLECY